MALEITVNLDGSTTKTWIPEPVLDEQGNIVLDENGNVVMDTAPDGVLD